ncbi:neutral ceramidase-like [Portunus trituberculatus]|uniref:neutral ceramidase-like n=1 Tax=Portunus trituberculatus TaxID=210409 RepID=UPI001E1CFBA7|nr:neutral ceramidase-like [Portunus trituberculatus]
MRQQESKVARVTLAVVVVVLACMAGGAEGLAYDLRDDPSLYNIGVGIYDVTGPAAGVNMMGYANPAQVNSGIHMRLFSRAFILDDTQRRLVFVSVDCGMMGSLIKTKVLEKLRTEYGDMYTAANVILSGTHTHSGPAGFLQHLLFDITSLGFIWQTFDAMVEGIFQSIKEAHNSVVPGYIYLSSGEILDASINRSPTSYVTNPAEELARYSYDTDKTMTLLRLEAQDGTPLGMVNWFAVHPTSMNNTNTLISGDNKGYASQLFEEVMNPGAMPGKGKFVAAFAQSNCGDVSPNIQGARCIDTGLPCDLATSTCDGKVQNCIASGPGKDMMESTKIIGTRQFAKAVELYSDPNAMRVSGPVHYAQQFIDMSNYRVNLKDGTEVFTCLPALGYSFAAGTIDGPGAFDFTQGTTEGNPFWDIVSGLLHKPSEEQVACHAPKPILLDTGELNKPYPWHPRIMDTQMGLVGQLAILPVPGEFTTMCGRRFREKVASVLAAAGMEDVVPVLAGLSNEYSHYITTWEEYQMQRYEAASTIFGPHTCAAYIQQYVHLAQSILNGTEMPPGRSPPDLSSSVLSLLPGVLFDRAPLFSDFGDVVAQPYPLAYTGETVTAKFVSGHPRNDVQLDKTFLTVERLVNSSDVWEIVATDANWETRFIWDRVSLLLGTSLATVKWDIPHDTPEGTYRITHSGHYKSFLFGVYPYSGVTESFQVMARPDTTLLEYAEVPQQSNSGSALHKPWLSFGF